VRDVDATSRNSRVLCGHAALRSAALGKGTSDSARCLGAIVTETSATGYGAHQISGHWELILNWSRHLGSRRLTHSIQGPSITSGQIPDTKRLNRDTGLIRVAMHIGEAAAANQRCVTLGVRPCDTRKAS
jgi:hypothetical protein